MQGALKRLLEVGRVRGCISGLKRIGMVCGLLLTIVTCCAADPLAGSESGGRHWFNPREFVADCTVGRLSFSWAPVGQCYRAFGPGGVVYDLFPETDEQYDFYIASVLDSSWGVPAPGRYELSPGLGDVQIVDVTYGPDASMARGFELWMHGFFGAGLFHLSFALLREMFSWVFVFVNGAY